METFIARQPIFDRKAEVVAYELLFRSSLENYFNHPDPNEASSRVIADSFLLFDLSELTCGKKAFINVTGEVLIREYARLLPREQTVIEILETVQPGPDVFEACRRLKEAGYVIALDDFVYDASWKPLIELADIIKIDFLESDPATCRNIVKRLNGRPRRFLAEKVETRAVFDAALEMGYSLFQGYFFSRPVVLQSRDLSPNKFQYLRFLREIYEPETDFGKLESIIRSDVSLSYKLLRYINSPFFGIPGEIESIRQALLLLGEIEVKKWATLLALSSMAEDKPAELVTQALVRALFLEVFARRTGRGGDAAAFFLTGLLSLIDAMMDRPLDDILSQLPVTAAVREALLGRPNPLREAFEIMTAYERADWRRLSERCAAAGVPEADLPEIYTEAIRKANESLRGPAGRTGPL